MSRLSVDFFQRDALSVARDLLGKELRHDEVVLKITEVEAYRWPGDDANHGRAGKTSRNATMWGPAGRAYVYLCYGIHHLLNIVTGAEGSPSAVLIRSCSPLKGLDTIQQRRGTVQGIQLLNGPGKVGQALGLDLSWDGHPVTEKQGLEIHDSPAVTHHLSGPRIGIDFASEPSRSAPWRLAAGPWGPARRLAAWAPTFSFMYLF